MEWSVQLEAFHSVFQNLNEVFHGTPFELVECNILYAILFFYVSGITDLFAFGFKTE